MNRDTGRQALNVLALVVTIAVNSLASALPLNGQTTGEISDRFRIFFVPAGYVFSIWGVIYLGLLAFAVYQALPAQRANVDLRRLGYLFVWSCVANTAWIFLWHFEVFPLTLPVMVGLLLALIGIYRRLGIGRARVAAAQRWLAHVPFSIYLGWITVATIANATQLLYWLGWNGAPLGPEVWAVIMLAIAVVVAALMAWRHADVAYLAVLVWAFVGIAIKHAAAPMVATAAWAASALTAFFLVGGFLRKRRRLAGARLLR
jgi:hypothetical protein